MKRADEARRGLGAREDPDLADFRLLMEGLQGGMGGGIGAGEDPLVREAGLVARIREAMPEEEVPEGFRERVMEAIRHPWGWGWRRTGVVWLRAAAVVGVMVVGGGVMMRAWEGGAFGGGVGLEAAGGGEEVTPLIFLARAQRADGSWGDGGVQAEDFRPRYGAGISSLALLAVVYGAPDGLGGEHGPVVRRGVAHLVSLMDERGCIGERFTGWDFNQYLAAKALEAAAGLPGAPEAWGRAASAALRQVPDDALSRARLTAMNRRLARGDVGGEGGWERIGGPVLAAAIRVIRDPRASWG